MGREFDQLLDGVPILRLMLVTFPTFRAMSFFPQVGNTVCSCAKRPGWCLIVVVFG